MTVCIIFLINVKPARRLLHAYKSRCTIWFYNVPSILYDDFMDIYCEALSTKVYPLHLTEAYTVLSHPRRFGLPFSTDEGENRRFDDNS
jgi:hypothetical protein